jgi:dienelactone hydrolase
MPVQMAISRRRFLESSAVALSTLAGSRWQRSGAVQRRDLRDVTWLDEVITAPERLPAPPRPLPPLLTDDGRTISTLNSWYRRRAELERGWRELLGSIDVARIRPPAVRVVGEDRVGEVVRELVEYENEPGVQTRAYVLRPRQSGLRRGVVVFHSTVRESIQQPAGLADVSEKHFGLALARRGFVAFCPRNFLWPDTTRMAADEETRRFHARHPRAKGMAKMLFDGQIALDILAAQPDVDRQRLGCIGHSLGAKEALYLAAFDDRISATVSSEGGIGTAMYNWDADWYLGPGVKDQAFAREHHELLALAAPRPFLLVGGDSADGNASWPYVAAAQRVYRLYGEPPRLGLLNHRQGHAVPADVLPRLLDWLETYV